MYVYILYFNCYWGIILQKKLLYEHDETLIAQSVIFLIFLPFRNNTIEE